jgi:hypothetical protein
MNMTSNNAWRALVDSVPQELVRTPEMSGPHLKAMMPAHPARMTQLMQKQEQMMRNMR